MRTRRALCKVYLPAWDSIETLDDEECQGQPKPAELEICENEPCNEPCDSNDLNCVYTTEDPGYSSSGPLPFKWRYGGYTQCSASCLGGE